MSIERISTIQTASVITQPDAVERPLTLVEKLRNRRKEWASNPHYWMDSNLISDVFNDVIDIVKQHSDWISVDERLPHAEEMLTNHYEPKEFYEIILKTGELLIASYTHMKNDGINEILFMDCTIVLTDGHWELLDAGFDGYQKDEVAYWKPIQPPSEVQA